MNTKILNLIVVLMAIAALAISVSVLQRPTEQPVELVSYNTACYREVGGGKWIAGSGCEWEMQSGATLDVQSGAAASFGGTLSAESILDVGTWVNLSAQSAVVVTEGYPITPTGTYQPITSTASVTTGTTIPIVAGTRVGDFLILHNDNVTFTITIDGTGGTVECKSNIVLVGQDTAELFWDGADWRCLSTYDNS